MKDEGEQERNGVRKEREEKKKKLPRESGKRSKRVDLFGKMQKKSGLPWRVKGNS